MTEVSPGEFFTPERQERNRFLDLIGEGLVSYEHALPIVLGELQAGRSGRVYDALLRWTHKAVSTPMVKETMVPLIAILIVVRAEMEARNMPRAAQVEALQAMADIHFYQRKTH